jgi:TRAP transporter 4TM/12TM fusion protein
MTREALKKHATLRNLIFVFALIQTVWLIWFFYTGFGGSQELVSRVLAIALILQILFMYQERYFYKWLPPVVNHIIVACYVGVCIYSFIYFHYEFERIAIYAQGSFTQQDYIVGLLIFLVVMELSRLAHSVLFWTNVVLVVYTLWGFLSPIDFFWHPGTSFYRVVTSSTVEFSTGIYGLYGQLALTLIAAFLLLAGVANGFGAQRAMINVVRLIAGRSRQLIPQTAVVGSSAIGMISGSGSANAAVVGTITIPLMMRYGVPGTFAAAIETSASMGGLIMPPMMGVGAFLMSEFLGVPYWDVVLRGFALAFVYYVSIGVAVYLLCVRLLPRDAIDKPQVPLYDKIKTGIFFSSVLYLIYLMGVVGKGELLAALYTATFMFVLLLIAYLVFRFVLKDPLLLSEDTSEPDHLTGYLLCLTCLVMAYLFRGSSMAIIGWSAAAAGMLVITFRTPALLRNFRISVETHAEMTSYLTLLLATLGIMIGLFTVTGFIIRMGAMLIDLGSWNIIAMIGMAWIFGWLAGAGLPPTATYIIGAVVIVRPMMEFGINPWVAHFFVFLLSVWGELSPPTSLTAAVSARIANASFLKTMYEALKICAPITLMTFAIFTRYNMVVNPGWLQIADTTLVLISTLGITFAMFGRCHPIPTTDILLRCLLAAISFVTMFHPDMKMSAAVAVVVAVATGLGIWRHNQIAPPKTAPAIGTAAVADADLGDLSQILAEAKREI